MRHINYTRCLSSIDSGDLEASNKYSIDLFFVCLVNVFLNKTSGLMIYVQIYTKILASHFKT